MDCRRNVSIKSERFEGVYFLDYQYYIHSLSDLCLGVEKKIVKEIMHFHYMLHIGEYRYTYGVYKCVVQYRIWTKNAAGLHKRGVVFKYRVDE